MMVVLNVLHSDIGWLQPAPRRVTVPCYRLPRAKRTVCELLGGRIGRCGSAALGSNIELSTPATSIMSSPTLRRAALLLNRIQGLAEGGEIVKYLVSTSVDVINGTADWNVDELGRKLPGALVDELLEVSDAVQDLFNLDGEGQTEIRLTRRNGALIEGTHAGELVTATLTQTASTEMWGEFTSWEVTEASQPVLLGKRVMSCLSPADVARTSSGSDAEVVDMVSMSEAEAGDTLVLVDPDRAALGDLISYDALPDQCEGLAPLLNPGADDGPDEEFVENLLENDAEIREAWANPDVREATRFAERLKMLPMPEDRTRARLQRLQQWQVVRRALLLAKEDEELSNAIAALGPFADRLYEAVHRAQADQFGSFQRMPQLTSVTFSLLQAFGFLLATAALAFIAAQIAKSSLRELGERDLPVYTLRSDPSMVTTAQLATIPSLLK